MITETFLCLQRNLLHYFDYILALKLYIYTCTNTVWDVIRCSQCSAWLWASPPHQSVVVCRPALPSLCSAARGCWESWKTTSSATWPVDEAPRPTPPSASRPPACCASSTARGCWTSGWTYGWVADMKCLMYRVQEFWDDKQQQVSLADVRRKQLPAALKFLFFFYRDTLKL